MGTRLATGSFIPAKMSPQEQQAYLDKWSDNGWELVTAVPMSYYRPPHQGSIQAWAEGGWFNYEICLLFKRSA
jgi:hypothetical protein